MKSLNSPVPSTPPGVDRAHPRHRHPHRRTACGLLLWLLPLLPLLSGALRAAELPQTQLVRLEPGWNLIAFQVIPPDPSPEAVFGALGEDFSAAWTYDHSTRQWASFVRPGSPPSESNPVAPFPAIAIGRAYWIYMHGPAEWSILGTAPALTPALALAQGWNLVGLPTGSAALPEPVSLLSVLAASGLDYDVILRWETGLYR